MTYAPPRKWWYIFAAPFAVCQYKTIEQQIKDGMKVFDLRVRQRNGKWIFAHGFYEVKGDVHETLNYLEQSAKQSGYNYYVRLILETSKEDAEQEAKFAELCEELQSKKCFVCMGGNRKSDWKQIYNFGWQPELWQPVSSMAKNARWYERYVPLLYALRMNRKNVQDITIHTVTIMDFV